MNSGLTGTLVYNNTAFTRSLGSAMGDRYLGYSWASVVDQARTYTLDSVDMGTVHTVHIRAIPAFINGKFETTVRNTALVWEGKIGSGRPVHFVRPNPLQHVAEWARLPLTAPTVLVAGIKVSSLGSSHKPSLYFSQ